MSATIEPPHEMHILHGLVARIGTAIRGSFVGRGAAKKVARAAEADPRTAQGWLYGRNSPRSPELIALMAANETLEHEILAMVRDLREKSRCQ